MIMISTGKIFRLKRLFEDDNRVFIVAMDHGVAGITEGLEDLGKTIDIVAKSGADAVMINIGIVKNYQKDIAGRIGLVATTEYNERSIVEAVKVDASAVKTTYLGRVLPDDTVKDQIRQVGLVCDEWGMPYMAECIPAEPSGKLIFDVDLMKKAARLAGELGADIVKSAYTGSRDGFRKVVEACPVPIVIAGGPRAESDKENLKMVKDTIDAGGAGVAIGRNIWQHRDPAKMTEAIAKIIHDNTSVEEALKILK